MNTQVNLRQYVLLTYNFDEFRQISQLPLSDNLQTEKNGRRDMCPRMGIAAKYEVAWQ